MDHLFNISDPQGAYTTDQIVTILEKAEKQGHPLEAGSYLEHMTVKQLALLTNGHYDC
jgi:hypothetical protein